MKKMTAVLTFALSFTLPMNSFACFDLPIQFKVSGSSFSQEEFQLRKSENGPVFYNNNNEMYFNHAKRKWCVNDTGAAKDKEQCLSAGVKISLTDSKAPNKKIGTIQLSSDERSLILRSIDSNGQPDLSIPYLRITDESDYLVAKCPDCGASLSGRMTVEMIDRSGVKGKAEVNGPNGSVDKNGRVSFPRTRGLSVAKDSAPAEELNASDLSGKYMSKDKGCGVPVIENYQVNRGAGSSNSGSGSAAK